MRKFGGTHADQPSTPHPRTEDPVERQYRFLLRSAPVDALEAAHAQALEAVPEDVRAAVLATVQDALVAGQRLTTADTGAMARLVTAGERRSPGAFLTACPSVARRRLAQAVVDSEAVFGLFTGYAAWDGAEPEPADVGVDHGGAHAVDRGDPAAAGKAFAYGHGLTVTSWGTGGGGS
ncbi:hypothetical protein GCM10009867_26740 [Pedococcus aerophilus]|uniref:Uncharacterized protein n=1 Tax=Pedococcus aerophilus TaxID=436356 RepID=A0ABP6H7A0_9MICO